MDKILEQALLYDFYGELLTSHQRSVYEDIVYNDLSLGEIAKEQGISRQGVHDLIKRCDKILQDYESKLHLVEKFTTAREKIRQIITLTEELESSAEAAFGADGEKLWSQAVKEQIRQVRELSEELKKEW